MSEKLVFGQRDIGLFGIYRNSRAVYINNILKRINKAFEDVKGEKMEVKKYYSTPEAEILSFEDNDVLTLSGETGGLGNEVYLSGNEYGNSWW